MSFILNVIYVECQHAECHYTECHYAECRDASKASLIETAQKGKYKSNSCRVLYKIDLMAPGHIDVVSFIAKIIFNIFH
jgi:hypothetical protein